LAHYTEEKNFKDLKGSVSRIENKFEKNLKLSTLVSTRVTTSVAKEAIAKVPKQTVAPVPKRPVAPVPKQTVAAIPKRPVAPVSKQTVAPVPKRPAAPVPKRPTEAVATRRMVDVVRPLLGKEKSLTSLAATYTSGSVKSGLEMIAPDYQYRSIRGDGHCLFRAVAAGMFLLVKDLSEDVRENAVTWLDGHLKRIASELSTSDRAFLCEQLRKTKNTDVDALLCDPQVSDRLVSIFRKIAVAHEREQVRLDPESTMAVAIAEAGGGSSEAYFKAISTNALGSDLEIKALAESLQLNFEVLHVKAIGEGQPQHPDSHQFGPSKAPLVSLLFRPGHYDLALKF